MLNCILIGFMGAGKTTVGTLLARQLQVPMIDLDVKIQQQTGQTITEIFSQRGEAAFRQMEQQTLNSALHSTGILATGGGVIENSENRNLLQQTSTPVIYLQTQFSVAFQRIAHDAKRPLVQQLDRGALQKLSQKREAWYQTCARLTIRTDQLTPMQISQNILKLLNQ